jgi:pheromone shutdown protein TraB
MSSEFHLKQPAHEQPVEDLEINGSFIRLLGTAHVSRASVAAVEMELEAEQWDVVAIELCASRFRSFDDPNALQHLDLFQVIRTGKAPMVTAMLAMGAFQQRIAEQFGIEPGAEMRAAIDGARARDFKLELIDREVGTTLRRIYKNVPWWRRFYLFSGLIASVVVNEEIEEEEIEKLKEGDILETTFAQFSESAAEIYLPLITERDEFMAAHLLNEAKGMPGLEPGPEQGPGQESGQVNEQNAGVKGKKILAVVGAGHLKGLKQYLKDGIENPDATITRLNEIPTGKSWLSKLPWLIVALVFVGFGIGFSRSPELGWTLVVEWVVINGGLSALGTAIAGGHLLTILTAFLAAPITSLNPTIGAGIVTGLVEAYIRKPTVGDFSRLRTDTSSFNGWRHNRVARTLLVFFFSTLGSAAGTYLAGFRIGKHLLGG